MAQTEQQAKLAARLKELEPNYLKFRDPDLMVKFKAAALDDVFEVFSEGVIKPESAPFVVGRMYQALKGYREVVTDMREYESIEAKLAATAGDVAVR